MKCVIGLHENVIANRTFKRVLKINCNHGSDLVKSPDRKGLDHVLRREKLLIKKQLPFSIINEDQLEIGY